MPLSLPRKNETRSHAASSWLRFVVALLVSLLLLEGLLSLLGFPRFDACTPANESPWQPDREAFRVLRPETSIGVGRTNTLGLRGPVLPESRTPGAARILFIGDSTCWGLGVSWEETYAARAAKLAATRLDRFVEVVNGCIPGHSSFQARAMLDRLLRFEPDLVVFYLGARNDVDRHRYFPDAQIPDRMARREATWHRVRVFQAAEAAYDGLYKKLLRKPLSLARRSRVSPEDFRENLVALVEATEASGAASIILKPPWSGALLERYPLIPEYQRVLAEMADETNVIVVPLQPAFRARPEAALYQEDLFHFSAAGHEVAAQELASAVVALLALPPSVGQEMPVKGPSSPGGA